MASFRSLPLAPDERTTAFRGLVAIVRASPDLGRVGAKVVAWEGDPNDANEPALDACLWYRFTPTNEPASWGPQNTTFSPMLVRVEQQVAGCDAAEGYKAWRALERQIFGTPGDAAGIAAALEALYAVGISSVEVARPAGGIDREAKDAAARQRSEGLLRVHLYVPNPGL
jgi:hypothetical protein